MRTLKAAVVTKDKALAKGAAEAACHQERAVKAERELLLSTTFCSTDAMAAFSLSAEVEVLRVVLCSI